MTLGGIAAHGLLGREEASAALLICCEENGLIKPADHLGRVDLTEFNKTFRSGFDAGTKKPLDLPSVVTAEDFDELEEFSDDVVDGKSDCDLYPSGEEDKDIDGEDRLFRDVADWHGRPVPERKWLLDGVIPMGAVTLLSGDGGNGKSLMALQLAASVASGTAWLGRDVRCGKALFLSAEDPEDELHRRMVDVANAQALSLDGYEGNLLVCSLVDGDPILAELDKTKVLKPSALYKKLLKTVRAEKPDLVVLDTLANFFPGNENDRAQVMRFVNMIKAIAAKGCAVVVLAHPSKNGLQSGAGDSGSTAWNNGVRSRLYLDKIVENAKETNPNRRRISQKKNNYGPTDFAIAVEWAAGTYRPVKWGGRKRRSARAKFLELVDAYKKAGRPVHPTTGPSSAPNGLLTTLGLRGSARRSSRRRWTPCLPRTGLKRSSSKAPTAKREQTIHRVGAVT